MPMVWCANVFELNRDSRFTNEKHIFFFVWKIFPWNRHIINIIISGSGEQLMQEIMCIVFIEMEYVSESRADPIKMILLFIFRWLRCCRSRTLIKLREITWKKFVMNTFLFVQQFGRFSSVCRCESLPIHARCIGSRLSSQEIMRQPPMNWPQFSFQFIE